MPHWVFDGGNDAIVTACGEKADGAVRATGAGGCLVFGPYVDLPAGRLRATFSLAGPGSGLGSCDLVGDGGTTVVSRAGIDFAAAGTVVELIADIPPLRRAEFRLFVDDGARVAVTSVSLDLLPAPFPPPRADRLVGEESRKTFAAKLRSGFVDRYLSGEAVIEVGFRGYRDEAVVPIVPQAIGVDLGYPGYDGRWLPFADGSVDAIYSSHCLEHIPDSRAALADWYRLLKVGGYMVTVVPHQYLFEKQATLPSRSNTDHRRYYTPESLLAELRAVLPENGYRIRHLIENDQGFDYSRFPEEPSPGCYEIELVVEKIRVPTWRLHDGSVRSYGAVEFEASGPQPDRWAIVINSASENPWKVWGPYARLVPAAYIVTFAFAMSDESTTLSSDIVLDVAVDRQRVASTTLSGIEGRDRLRSGEALTFEVSGKPALVEFRVYAEGQPAPTPILFKGVDVQFVRDHS